jgi:hypothetical protein
MFFLQWQCILAIQLGTERQVPLWRKFLIILYIDSYIRTFKLKIVIFNPEDVGSMLLRNILPICRAAVSPLPEIRLIISCLKHITIIYFIR